ncbi:MAG: phytoene dehydrogenase-like protein [Myxococcota bacterium]
MGAVNWEDPWLSWRARAQVARWLGSLWTRPASGSVGDWLDAWFTDPDARAIGDAMVRLTTYANDPGLDAAVVAPQVAAGMRGVAYLDGGWQTLVESLADRAREARVTLRTSTPAVRAEEGRVVLQDGEVPADRIVLAVPPGGAAGLLPDAPSLAERAHEALPVKAACLDLMLRGHPDPARPVILGLDRPLYVSVHSTAADLAPAGITVAHAAWYRAPGDTSDRRPDVEAALDTVWPGWRDSTVHARYLPSMAVQHDTPRPERPTGTTVQERPDVQLVGAWTGGLLLDGALASAYAATHARRAAA